MIAIGDGRNDGVLAIWSDDGGESWQISTGLDEVFGLDARLQLVGNYLFITTKRTFFDRKEDHARILSSDDGGKSWQVSGDVGENYSEVSGIRVIGDRLIAIGGTDGLEIVPIWSDDGGKNWQTGVGLERIAGRASGVQIVGDRAVVVGGLVTRQPLAVWSDDEGTSWRIASSFGGTIGYLTALLVAGERLVAVGQTHDEEILAMWSGPGKTGLTSESSFEDVLTFLQKSEYGVDVLGVELQSTENLKTEREVINRQIEEHEEAILGFERAAVGQQAQDEVTKQIRFGLARLAVIGLLIYLVQILVNLYRYNMRLAGHQEARGNALLLIDFSKLEWKDAIPEKFADLAASLSSEKVDFGRAPSSPLDQAVQLSREIIRAGGKGTKAGADGAKVGGAGS